MVVVRRGGGGGGGGVMSRVSIHICSNVGQALLCKL